jgi:esterase/lipase superfamily enzyme
MVRARVEIPLILLLLAVAQCAGCAGGKTPLMPTPNLYARGDFDPFADVPSQLRRSGVDVLYLTDREREIKSPADSGPDNPTYGFDRSRSVAFGVSHVEFGENVSWEQLVQASRTSKRSVKLPMIQTKTTEVGRFPPTPKALMEAQPPEESATQPVSSPSSDPEYDQALNKAQGLLSEHLARTPVKDVYVFVHGYNNNFYDSVTTIAQLWHFLGRRGVPIAYSWPAGHGGLLKGYTYDRESSEFTVYHLKQAIRRISQNPDVHEIHIIAHSRGTDVAINTLRELHLEITGSGRTTRDVLKLGTLVLAAPDVDFDVLVQRTITAKLGRVPKRSTIYVCSKDNALGISNWLFGGMTRLGKLQSNVFTSAEMATMRDKTSVEFIDAQISKAGSFGHDYFHSSPAVSSDLILLLRYELPAGAEFGRPLAIEQGGFWMIDDKYPTPATRPTTQPST